jgi:diketogulonate reductase-like aldo/keto reductase
METRWIASLKISFVGLGCNNFGGRLDFDATSAIVDAALEAGVTFFDTAEKLLAALLSLTDEPREGRRRVPVKERP